jgi:triosephosphate isomerase
MHKTAAETAAFFDAFLPLVAELHETIDVVVAPPFTSLPLASSRLSGTRVKLGAQTMHWELQGAFTGEISAPMLLEFGVSYVILGHSERRAYCGENDRTVNLKVRTALSQGLTPIVAVGETLQEHDSGETDARVISQTLDAFAGIPPEELAKVVVAYEPIWAIGTGVTPTEADAEAMCRHIHARLDALAGGAADAVRVQYGGSDNDENAAAFLAQPAIDGLLVGGASLDAARFMAIARAGL